jgi:heterodisulfide reductase subunit C
MDLYALVILVVIMGSGILLEGAKMVSHSVFQEMADEYGGSDPDELKALEAYWVKDFGLVSPDAGRPFEPAVLEQGKAANELYCVQCHSTNRSAFAGYGASLAMRHLALELDRSGARTVLYYFHFLACLIGLACLPFTKMFHLIATPLSLLANAVMDDKVSYPANMETKRILELDACTHCGSCSRECFVSAALPEIGNINILPSEKMQSIKVLAAANGHMDAKNAALIQQGLHICTSCGRCASVCPSGIDTIGMWFEARKTLQRKAIPEFAMLSTFSLIRSIERNSLGEQVENTPLLLAREAVLSLPTAAGKPGNGVLDLTAGHLGENGIVNSFNSSGCFRCMTCSNSCPVVRNYPDAEGDLGLLPHQMMHAIGLKLWDMVLSSKMLWSCLGCYQCQQNCPQGVSITDILYQLKNAAISRTMRSQLCKQEKIS